MAAFTLTVLWVRILFYSHKIINICKHTNSQYIFEMLIVQWTLEKCISWMTALEKVKLPQHYSDHVIKQSDSEAWTIKTKQQGNYSKIRTTRRALEVASRTQWEAGGGWYRAASY